MIGSLSLANKYRPSTFDDGMIGQTAIVEILKSKMKSDTSTLQNYLLYGPRGTGKTTSARILAKAMNCTNLQDGNPCNQCSNCRSISEGTAVDYVEIDAASMTGVDNIRDEVIAKMSYPPVQLKKRVYVIDEVHMLSKQAFNALLKTIEEPGSNVCFILATTEIEKVLDTIISRCQVFQFKKVSEQDITDRLSYICDQEHFHYEREALELIALISDGCVRDAVKYLDQVSILPRIDQASVSSFLGISSEKSLEEFFQLVQEKHSQKVFDYIDMLASKSVDLLQFAKQCLRYLDKHFVNCMEFAVSFSPVLFSLIRQASYYPYLTLLYKIELSQYFSPSVITSSTVVNAPIQIEKKEKKIESVHENNPEVSPVHSSTTSSFSGDLVTLWKEAVLQVPDEVQGMNITIKKAALIQHVTLESIMGNTASLLVTNAIANLALSDVPLKTALETQLSALYGQPLVISSKMISKEEYAKSLF